MGVTRAAVLVALAALAACSGEPKPATATTTAPEKDAAYLGSEACRTCHAERWSTFSHTGMGRSWYPLTAERAIEDWTTRNAFDVKATGLRYRMFRRDGKFFMRQSLVDPKGRETAVDLARTSDGLAKASWILPEPQGPPIHLRPAWSAARLASRSGS